MAHIIRNGLIESLLCSMLILPGDREEARCSGLEQGLALRIDGDLLFGADHKGAHPLMVDAGLIGEGVTVQQLHQPHELIRFALMRCCGQQQQIGGGFGECRAELIAGYLFGTAAKAVRLIDDHEVPSG